MIYKTIILTLGLFTIQAYAQDYPASIATEAQVQTQDLFTVLPLTESIHKDMAPWKFQFTPALEKKANVLAGSGNIEIYNDQQLIVQKIPVDIGLSFGLFGTQIDEIEKTHTVTGVLRLHDFNNDGWKELIISNDYDPLGLIITEQFYQFDSKQKKFIPINEVSGKGSISPDTNKKNCLTVNYKKYEKIIDYIEEAYCYQEDKNQWINTQNNSYPSVGTD